MRIGIDLMGGDNPPEVLFPAILEAAKKLSSNQSLLVLATAAVNHQLSSFLSPSLTETMRARVLFHECADVITMSDHPLTAVRRKKCSSLVMGIHLLKDKKIDTLVSCGNTGALIAGAAIHLPLLPGITHPALLANLPTQSGNVAVLDVGGNVLKKAEHLVRFAFLGAAYQRAVRHIATPRVGLLNVGVESGKGTTEVRQAYENLSQNPVPEFTFVGNVEGRDLFKGNVDVLVTDGFTGNVLLKTAEGIASFIFASLEDKVKGGSADFQKTFHDLKRQFNYAEYPGAIVCGIEAVMVKVHGNATAESLLMSIALAMECCYTLKS